MLASNVETSTCITNALYGALGTMASGQCTMNNFTFGNARSQYYETISGGSGAGPDFDGTSVVQTHMTNSRLTDPEVLEFRFPVRLESYEIRPGSGGAGRHRGGDGGIRRVRFLEAMTASILPNGRHSGAFGVAVGQPGEPRVSRLEAGAGRPCAGHRTVDAGRVPGDGVAHGGVRTCGEAVAMVVVGARGQRRLPRGGRAALVAGTAGVGGVCTGAGVPLGRHAPDACA